MDILTLKQTQNMRYKMTCIVSFVTRKQLKEAINNNHDFFIEDPAWINPQSCMASKLPEGKTVVVTNHPKRSWFAKITKKDGKLRLD